MYHLTPGKTGSGVLNFSKTRCTEGTRASSRVSRTLTRPHLCLVLFF